MQENNDLYEQLSNLIRQWNIPLKCQHSVAVFGQCGKTVRKSTSHAWGTQWGRWFRHCATSQKVAGSIPDGVIGIYHRLNPSGHTMALELTHPLTEISITVSPRGLTAASA